ncbi:MAG TPA: HDOD domain-containing protein [Fimbriimonadaceae bacterium]|jgi:putative nucleotidyltransferase with HDIG domain
MVTTSLTIEDIVKKTPDLPTIPAAALAVMREADSSVSTAHSVAAQIAQDQALTARVLRLSNSAYYGLSRQVVDLQEAVVVLGMRCVRNLAVVAATYPWMSKPLKGYMLAPKQMWTHSFGVAVAAQLVAKKTGSAPDETSFIAGLLHNIGKVALSIWLENKLPMMMNMAIKEGIPFDELERKVLGFDHADVGAFLGEQWNLPKIFIEAIHYHHRPDECIPPNSVVDCVHVGDYLTMAMGFGLGGDGLRYDVSENALARIGLSETDVDELTEDFVKEYQKYESLFEEMSRD